MNMPASEPNLNGELRLMRPKEGRRRVLITGASGALGGALARRIAGPTTELLLWGRNVERLSATAGDCRARGACVMVRQVELSDCVQALAALSEELLAGQIDDGLLVAGQGDTVPDRLIAEPPDQVARLAAVNFSVPSALAAALADHMARHGKGRILLVGSAASFHALPHAPGYAASKAGLSRFAQALGVAVAPAGVRVTLVSPGFIDWPGGGRPVPRFLMLTVDQAARRILAALEAEVDHAIIPRRFALLRVLDRALPKALRNVILHRLKP